MVCVVLFALQMRSSSCCTAALDGNEFIAAFTAGTVVLPAAAEPVASNNTTETIIGIIDFML
jgi:hypothetical protein